MKRIQEATDAFQRACEGSDKGIVDAATRELVEAQRELHAAKDDAASREKVADGGRRRDRAISIEQQELRERLFEALELPHEYTIAPSTKGNRITIEVDPVMREAIEEWTKACNAMGNATFARWLVMAGILKSGPPPGWEGEWPPKLDGDDSEGE